MTGKIIAEIFWIDLSNFYHSLLHNDSIQDLSVLFALKSFIISQKLIQGSTGSESSIFFLIHEICNCNADLYETIFSFNPTPHPFGVI